MKKNYKPNHEVWYFILVLLMIAFCSSCTKEIENLEEDIKQDTIVNKSGKEMRKIEFQKDSIINVSN